MPANDSFMIHYAEGRGTNLGKAKNRIIGWADFCKQFSTPTKTKERRKAFDKMSKEQQDDLKSVDGWIIGAQVADGKRRRVNIQPRDLLSLDYDYATPTFLDQIKLGVTPLSDKEFFVHSSRRHTDEKPRIRLFAPLSRPVTPEEYIPLSRIIAMLIEGPGMKMVDKVSFRVAQMMFKPTISVDGDWFAYRNTGDLIDPDDLFDWFTKNHGDWHDYSRLPLCADEEDLRKHSEKAENPLEKKGPVGDFCRAYDVPAAIEKFLPDIYGQADDWSAKPRYTYLPGTTTSGAVVEDDGLFLYSHHGSDPTADMLVNAFDLVRLHLFGELDEGTDKDTPPTKWPSYKRMIEFIADDPEYRRSQAETRYDISAMFDDVADDYVDGDETEDSADFEPPEQDEEIADLLGFDDDIPVGRDSSSGTGFPGGSPQSQKRRKRKPPKDWFPDALTLDNNGRIESTMPNASVIVHNDARLFDAICFNEFTKQIVCRRDIKSRLDIAPEMIVTDHENGDAWQDFNDISIRMILEAPNGPGKVGYGMKMTDRDLNGAIVSAARRNAFHPIREWLDELERDGVERISTLFARYLGVEDNAYHAEIARWVLVASVARIYEPGHKFDFAPILQGETGLRKSSFIKVLYGENYFGEIDCNLGDTQAVAEVIAGIWGGELPELQGLHKADHNSAKAFMRRQIDKVRMAYDRRTSNFKRQMVVWGSTNDKKYLKDPTGNRSYWPVIVNFLNTLPRDAQGDCYIDTDSLEAERTALWAEAVAIYREMREKQPRGTLPLFLQSAEARRIALQLQEEARTEELHELWADRIATWLDEPVPLYQFKRELGIVVDSFDEHERDLMVQRCVFTREQAVELALKKDRGVTDYQTAQNIGRALPELDGWYQKRSTYAGAAAFRIQGKLGRWWLRDDATEDERLRGYRIVLSASAGDDSEDDIDHLI